MRILLILIFLSSCSLLPYVDVEIELKHPSRKAENAPSSQTGRVENLETLADRILYEYKNAGILRAMCNHMCRNGDFSFTLDRYDLFFELSEDR